MCTKAEFVRLRDLTAANAKQNAENSKQIGELQKADAVQSEQLKTLFHTTERLGDRQDKALNRLVFAVVAALFLALLAVIYGALGKNGFNAVTKAAPISISSASAEE